MARRTVCRIFETASRSVRALRGFALTCRSSWPAVAVFLPWRESVLLPWTSLDLVNRARGTWTRLVDLPADIADRGDDRVGDDAACFGERPGRGRRACCNGLCGIAGAGQCLRGGVNGLKPTEQDVVQSREYDRRTHIDRLHHADLHHAVRYDGWRGIGHDRRVERGEGVLAGGVDGCDDCRQPAGGGRDDV